MGKDAKKKVFCSKCTYKYEKNDIFDICGDVCFAPQSIGINYTSGRKYGAWCYVVNSKGDCGYFKLKQSLRLLGFIKRFFVKPNPWQRERK